MVRFVDVTDLTAMEAALVKPRPTALLVETISNPLLKVADLPTLGDLAHSYGAQLLVDNTFASPYLCNPLVYGADFVIHSATKFIGGHGDVMAGVVVTSAENRRTLYELNKLVGGVQLTAPVSPDVIDLIVDDDDDEDESLAEAVDAVLNSLV